MHQPAHRLPELVPLSFGREGTLAGSRVYPGEPAGGSCTPLKLRAVLELFDNKQSSGDRCLVMLLNLCGPGLHAVQQSPRPGPGRLRLALPLVQGYLAVAVVKKANEGPTWNSLGKARSRKTPPWTDCRLNIPMGLIANQTGSCAFGRVL